MKKKIILGVISIAILCLTAYGMALYLTTGEKTSMSFEEAIDSITHSEISEMITNSQIYEHKFSINSHFSIPEDNIEAKLKIFTDSKQNLKDSEGETKIAIRVDASLGENESIIVDGDAIMKYLSNAIYFKLNSLNIDTPDFISANELGFDIESIKDKWFSFELTEEIINTLKDKLPEDFDLNKTYNEENLQKVEADLERFKYNLKKSINNEGSLIYSGIYSEFNGYNARKFSINKEKVFNAAKEYIKALASEGLMEEDYIKEMEEIDIDEIFEDFPLKNFEGYLVIIGKNKVQIIIENLDIEDYSTMKLNGTFGEDMYNLSIKEYGDEVLSFSAKLNKSHYDVSFKFADLEILKGTITPKKSQGKFSVNFDLSIDFELYEKISIPLKGGWSWEEIPKFNVERPTNSKNLLEDVMGSMMEDIDSEVFDPAFYQAFAGGMQKQSLSVPFVAGGILLASITPRMQSAQGRARDVARKNDLAQIQTAIITSQQDRGAFPGTDRNLGGITNSSSGTNANAKRGMIIDNIGMNLQRAGMSSIPTDPDIFNVNYGLGKFTSPNSSNKANGKYIYLVAKRNGVNDAGFVLMAKTESEGGSNRVVCRNKSGIDNGYITNEIDLKDINICKELVKGDLCSAKNCTYSDKEELRYILLY